MNEEVEQIIGYCNQFQESEPRKGAKQTFWLLMYKINWKKVKKQRKTTNNLHLDKVNDKFIIIIIINTFLPFNVRNEKEEMCMIGNLDLVKDLER